MNIDTRFLVPMTEANQNFSKVVRLVDESGMVVILKNNKPRYVVLGFNQVEQELILSGEDVMSISRRIMEKNQEAYKVLAQWKADKGAGACAPPCIG